MDRGNLRRFEKLPTKQLEISWMMMGVAKKQAVRAHVTNGSVEEFDRMLQVK